ncbi:SDR family oxidoreductase [Nocardia rhizosphaerae]|uniref:SDR family oxidoreductase n=1 Tax=Nocardia rhizosphaerae TaxID=1691571 RepID=A0ABV8L9A1_9NOCA
MSNPILLTGATGVVGTALRERLATRSYTALTHRTPLLGVDTVTGDITAPRFGLDETAYIQLVEDTRCVLHCAANTSLNADPAVLADDNACGTRHAIELANDADAPLIHVSTAFVEAIDRAENRGARLNYAESKLVGERLVTDRARRWTIVRPSIVIGDSSDGHIAGYQGLFRLAELVRDGRLPFFPCGPDSRVDIIAQDVVAATLAHLSRVALERGDTGHDLVWLTSGATAPRVWEVIEAFLDAPRSTGEPRPHTPRFIDRDQYERLIRPAFLSELDPSLARRIDNLFTHVAPYVSIVDPFPDATTIGDYQPAVTDPLLQLNRSLDHWVRVGAAARPREEAIVHA